MKSFTKFALALVLFAGSSVASATQFWQNTSAMPDFDSGKLNAKAENARYVNFRHEDMQQQFLLSTSTPFDFTVPTPEGVPLVVTLVEDSVMEPGLAAKFPGIKSYKALNNKGEQIGRFSFSHRGLRGMYLYNNQWAYIDPLFHDKTENYISYYRKDARRLTRRSFNEIVSNSLQSGADANVMDMSESAVNTGDSKITYRLAVSTTAEYTARFSGVAGALAEINNVVNRINQVYLVDLAVDFVLVNNNDAIIFTDASSDPFNNDSDDIDLNQDVVDGAIGSANYDIGHVFTTSDGGVAALGSVCSTSFKAEGLTGLPNPTGDRFYIDYVAHELGHQFGGRHSYNGTDQSCGPQRSPSTAWEPGSGSTIMGYASICDVEDIQEFSDAFFHIGSVEEIRRFIDSGNGGSCGTVTSLNNTRPTVDAGEDYVIPANTPFVLTGSGDDADGDTLTYNWEQLDLGTESSNPITMNDDGSRPIFRSWPGTSEPKRYLPRFEDVLVNRTVLGEAYPTTTRDLNFRLTVRDGNGGVNTDAMKVTSIANESGFQIVQPSSSEGWSAGISNLLIWTPAGSSAAPINCSTVHVDISSDGGATFEALATDIANDGVATITSPASIDDYRLRISCSDNIFYAVNQGDFSVSSSSSITDTDGDGMPDDWEAANGLDPSNPADGVADADGDGLTNLEEYLLGLDPFDTDTNGNGISDIADVTGEEPPVPDGGIDASTEPGSIPYDFENDRGYGNWSFGIVTPWEFTTEQASTGEYSLVSGPIIDNSETDIVLVETLQAGVLSFDYKVSTEAGFDFLQFYIDDELIQQWSGENDWVTFQHQVEAGEHTLLWRYVKDQRAVDGQDKVWIDNIQLEAGAELNITTVDFSFENNEERQDFDLSGTTPWTVTSAQAFDGSVSVTSPSLTNNQSSSFSYTGEFVSGDVTFYAKVSSETDYDFLNFYIDGSLVRSWSGELDWFQATQNISAGEHTLTWQYSKDESVSNGNDKAWVDLVSLPLASVNPEPEPAPEPELTGEELVLGFESASDIQAFELSDIPWAVASDNSFNGSASIATPTLANEQYATIDYTGNFVGGLMTFAVKVSSEARSDYLDFFVDGVLIESWSGEQDWVEVPYVITEGSHTLQWRYVKDAEGAAGSDKAWVDVITLPLVDAGGGSGGGSGSGTLVDFDFDNDDIADIAVRRGSNFFTYIDYSGTDDIGRVEFGRNINDIPVTGDFDGDGIFDVAVRRPSNQFWYIKNSSGVDTITDFSDGITRRAFGLQEGDIPVPADYDGDGITDLAVRRPSNQFWYILNSSKVDPFDNNADGISRIRFGTQEEDIPVVADFDGDGKADLAVRRPSTQFWYIKNSSGVDPIGGFTDGISRIRFGQQKDDIPVVADYDGDGRADLAVRRPATFFWYVRNSSLIDDRSNLSDGISRVQFGRDADDIPVVADYDGDGRADFAVRRASNQFFYIQNSSKSNFNSSNGDGIQRVNFGRQEADIPLAAPVLTRMAMAASN